MTHPLGHALSVRSDFSVAEGAQSIPNAVDRAKELGYSSIALVDTMSVSGLPALFNSAKKAAIKPIVGCTLRVYADARYRPPKKGETHELKPNPEFRIKVYITSEAGLQSLFRLLSEAFTEECFYYNARTDLDMIERILDPEGVKISTGDFKNLFHLEDFVSVAARIKAKFETFVEIVPINTPLFDTLNSRAAATARVLKLPMIATYPALYAESEDKTADVLRAITTNKKIDDLFLEVPYVRDMTLHEPKFLVDKMKELFDRGEISATEAREALQTTARFADGFSFQFEKMKPSLPKMATDEFSELVKEVKLGWKKRFENPVMGHMPKPEDTAVYKERLAFELDVLRRMGFSGYFLLVQDIVRWSKSNGIAVGPGRGSVGGSLVAYLMEITDVDPIRFDLLFERFINPDRLDLPDADLDFMSSRRHEVIERIEKVYGADRVAGISNYSTLAAASALRDSARVFGLEQFEYACSKQMEKEHGVSLSLEESAERVPDIEKFKNKFPEVWEHAVRLEGSVRNMGKHAAGVVVAGVPVSTRGVIESRSGQRVVNWDKASVEEWGLIKIDILGLSTLDTLSHAKQYILERHHKRIDFLSLPLDDKLVLQEFAKGNTAGIFQFESLGMRKILMDLSKRELLTFDDLVATTALFRPGPLDAGLCDEYVAIKQGSRSPFYEHENMRRALEPTHGVIIYQEQVMAICRDVAGFTMTEADHVRKAMGKKDKEKMASYREKFIAGAHSVSGMGEYQASSLWDKIEVFAGYAFNKSHSVEYTVISWWAMWLKTYYPAEFYAAALSTVEKEEKVGSLVLDARKNKIEVFPPDINLSSARIEIRGERDLLLPFQSVKGLSEKAAQAIIEARTLNGGKFESFADFERAISENKMAARCNATARSRLNAVGAFHSVDGGLSPLHTDRLKDRLEYLAGYTIDAVKADRTIVADTFVMSKIVRLHEETRSCEGCSLKGAVHPAPRMGKSPKFMVVFDSPNWQEEKAGRMLEGDSASYFKAAMKDAGLSPNDGYYTSLVKAVKPKGAKVLSNEQINGCSGYLKQEIETLKPPVIVVMGSAGMRHFAPSVKGSPAELIGKVMFDSDLDASIVFGLNPGQVIYDTSKVAQLQTVCQRIAELIH